MNNEKKEKKTKKQKKIVINLDDLGMSPGTNKAIFNLFEEGTLPIRASIIATTGTPFQEAMNEINKRKDLNLGIHLSLTYGKSLTGSNRFSSSENIFNLTFFDILLRSKSKYFLVDVENEFRSQIISVMKVTRKITHINTHQHIHAIPAINKIILKLAKEFHICDIRGFKEKPIMYLNSTKAYSRIFSTYAIKFNVVKFMGFFREKRKERYLYSILFSEIPLNIGIFSKLIVFSRSNCIEILAHVGDYTENEDHSFFTKGEERYHNSEKRLNEYKQLLALSEYVKKVKNRKKELKRKATS